MPTGQASPYSALLPLMSIAVLVDPMGVLEPIQAVLSQLFLTDKEAFHWGGAAFLWSS